LLLCYVFLPVYRKLRVYTLSQYLEYRYNETARLLYTVLMITLIVVQLVAGFYIGGRTLRFLLLNTPLEITYLQGIALMAAVTCSYTMFGGLNSIVATDNLQSVMMLLAGLIVAFLTFSQPEIGGLGGLLKLEANLPRAAQKMHMYLPADHPDLPWSGVLTGLVILHMFYYCNNQYLVQRTLAATSDNEAKIGIIAASFLKLLIPLFSITCGIAAAHLFRLRFGGLRNVLPDDAFLQLIATVVPTGLRPHRLHPGRAVRGHVFVHRLDDERRHHAGKRGRVQEVPQPGGHRPADGAHGPDHDWPGGGGDGAAGRAHVRPHVGSNFFLSVSNRGGYFTQGIVVAFMLGIWWKGLLRGAPLPRLVAAPLFAFGIRSLLQRPTGHPAGRAGAVWPEAQLHAPRFLTFLFSLGVHAVVSRLLPDRDAKVSEDTLAPGLPVRQMLLVAACLGGLVLAVMNGWLPSVAAGAVGALLTFGLFLYELRKSWPAEPVRDNRVYAGALCGVVVFLLFWFP
jgi:SSS family solute:Na+ symporter